MKSSAELSAIQPQEPFTSNDLPAQLVATNAFPKNHALTYNARRSLTAEARIRSQLQESHIDLSSIKKLEVKPSKIATLSFYHQGRQEFKIMFKLFQHP